MGELLRDVWDEFIKADNKFFRTMIPLLFRPGFLTRRYAEGKRVRYLSPFRLYLVISALFFSLLSQHSPIPHSADSVTLGQQIDRWQNAAKSKKATSPKRPAPKLKPPGEVTFSLSDDGEKGVRIVHLFGRTIDLFAVPDTWNEYDARQKKLTVGKRDDLQTRWIMGRIIAAKNFTGQSYLDHLLSTMPKVMFVIMPVFALILKVLYVRSRRPYVQHFILALHIHTVYFVLSGITLFVPNFFYVEPPSMGLYTFVAMRTLYGQSFAKTFVKWTLLSWNYAFALLIGVLALLMSFVF